MFECVVRGVDVLGLWLAAQAGVRRIEPSSIAEAQAAPARSDANLLRAPCLAT